MKLTVPFNITIDTVEFRKNYTGVITLSPKNASPKTYYFIVLNPYGGKTAEFSLCEDRNKTKVFAEGIGESQQGFHPITLQPVTCFDFSIHKDDPRLGMVWVLSQIILEGIYQAEISGAGKGKAMVVSHYWEQDFKGQAESAAQSFLQFFGL